MFNSSKNHTIIFIVLLLAQWVQSCAPVNVNTTSAPPTTQVTQPAATKTEIRIEPTPTQQVSIANATPSVASLPKVHIRAVKGNIFIRRGPGMAYNPTGALYKNTSAEVIARDVLSNWVQIKIPHSNQTGWVSIQTEYTQIEGDIAGLPDFTPTEWPTAAYLRNCTHHRMYVLPNEIVIYPAYTFPDNEIWLYPGNYTVYDIDVPGDPQVASISIHEGSDVEILDDGLGGHRKCP